MDSSSIISVLAILLVAVVVAFVLLRVMRARQRTAGRGATSQPPLAVDEEEYLDSSHIIHGADPRLSDAALRKTGKKPKS